MGVQKGTAGGAEKGAGLQQGLEQDMGPVDDDEGGADGG